LGVAPALASPGGRQHHLFDLRALGLEQAVYQLDSQGIHLLYLVVTFEKFSVNGGSFIQKISIFHAVQTKVHHFAPRKSKERRTVPVSSKA
jgi:hypothetical protein